MDKAETWLCKLLEQLLPSKQPRPYKLGGPSVSFIHHQEGVLLHDEPNQIFIDVEMCGANLREIPAKWQTAFLEEWQRHDGGKPVLARCQTMVAKHLYEWPTLPDYLRVAAWLLGVTPAEKVPQSIQNIQATLTDLRDHPWKNRRDLARNIITAALAILLFALLVGGCTYWAIKTLP